VLWNDGPRLRALDGAAELDLAPREEGKGRNVWYCMGFMLGARRVESIAMHDCDILTYERSLLARLIYPVANPQFNYEFCKGFYARVANGKINGRVSRLLVTPLLRALKKTLGRSSTSTIMDSFRYPLAGEFSFRRDVLTDLRIPSDWGLEIGVLSEMYRNYSNNRLCQVDIADNYDHKHQSLSADDASAGLSRMSIDICKALFRKLATRGVVFSSESFRSAQGELLPHCPGFRRDLPQRCGHERPGLRRSRRGTRGGAVRGEHHEGGRGIPRSADGAPLHSQLVAGRQRYPGHPRTPDEAVEADTAEYAADWTRERIAARQGRGIGAAAVAARRPATRGPCTRRRS
jgi:hypothetical protein